MTDIVPRLRVTHAEVVQSDGGECEFIAMFREAADEIERLRAENEWRRSAAKAWEAIAQTNQELCDEIEQLRAMLEKSPPAATG
jgi:hypothetical protein